MTQDEFVALVRGWGRTGDRPESLALCGELLDRYVSAPGAVRAELRGAVRRNRVVWNPATGNDCLSAYLNHTREHLPALGHLRAQLTLCALTGGLGDWRDTIVWLTGVWAAFTKAGIDPRPHFQEIAKTADDLNSHGLSGLSTRGLFRNAVTLAEQGGAAAALPVARPPQGGPCPKCGKALRSRQAKQCFECGADWHDGMPTLPPPARDPDATRDQPSTAPEPPDDATGAYVPGAVPAAHVPPSAGRYRFEGEIARGGMGVVYRATDTEFDREVAVKVFGPNLTGPDAVRRFYAEARITGRLQHPSVPPVHDLGTLPDGRPFLAMKLIRGKTLADHVRDVRDASGGYPPEEFDRLVRVFEQICLAVAFAHSRRVIHRDLKPANVMVGAFGEVQVMDWGLAKALRGADFGGRDDGGGDVGGLPPAPVNPEPESGSTKYGAVLGTPAYMPPEQARGESDAVDERADVFALGGVLCFILTGKPPYVGSVFGDVYKKASDADLADALARLDAVTGAGRLPGLAKRCLAANAKLRPAHAGEVAAAVATAREWAERVKRGEELTNATVVAEDSTRTAERRARRAVALGITGLAAGLFVAGLSWLSVKAGEATQTESAGWARRKKPDVNEEFNDLVDAIAHGIESGRFAPGWDGQHRRRMAVRVDQFLRDLDPPAEVKAKLVLTAMQDAAREFDAADSQWRDAVSSQARVTPDQPEAELAVAAAAVFGKEKPAGAMGRLILTRAGKVLARPKPAGFPPDLAARADAALKAVEAAGVKWK